MEEGKITEEGTHEELMKQQGRYARLYRYQAEKYNGTGMVQGKE